MNCTVQVSSFNLDTTATVLYKNAPVDTITTSSTDSGAWRSYASLDSSVYGEFEASGSLYITSFDITKFASRKITIGAG